MSSNTVLQMGTAMGEDSKIRSLSNEVVRRMTNTSELLPDTTRWEIIDDYAQKLKNSGYGLQQTRRILVGGLKGYEARLQESKTPGGRKLHRTAGESNWSRARKKLLGKSEWFRGKAKTEVETAKMGPPNSEDQPHNTGGATEGKKGQKTTEMETKTVLFCEQTRNGELARRLKEVESRMSEITGFRTRIVEGVGNKLQQLLSNSNPWSGAHCGREDCTPCNQGGENLQDCTRRGIIYESVCTICNPEGEKKEKIGDLRETREFPSIYVGESGRSLYERAGEHWRDYRSGAEDSHILKHWTNHHQSQGEPAFRIRVIKTPKDALSRQVGEAVRIQLRGSVLNSKGGFNRSGISRLVLETKPDGEDEKEATMEAEERHLVEDLVRQGENQVWNRTKMRGNVHDRLRMTTATKRTGDNLDKRPQKKKKKKHPMIGEDWGVEAMDEIGLRDLHERETARTRFLMSGPGLRMVGGEGGQSEIIIWSEMEVWARKILRDMIAKIVTDTEEKRDMELFLQHTSGVDLAGADLNEPWENEEEKAKTGPPNSEDQPHNTSGDTNITDPQKTKITSWFKTISLVEEDKERERNERELRLWRVRIKKMEWSHRRQKNTAAPPDNNSGYLQVPPVPGHRSTVTETIKQFNTFGWKTMTEKNMNAYDGLNKIGNTEVNDKTLEVMKNTDMDNSLIDKTLEMKNMDVVTCVKEFNSDEVMKIQNIKFVKSPVRDLIVKFEKVANHDIQDENEEYVEIGKAKQIKKYELKKVWKKKKNGLFGWSYRRTEILTVEAISNPTTFTPIIKKHLNMIENDHHPIIDGRKRKILGGSGFNDITGEFLCNEVANCEAVGGHVGSEKKRRRKFSINIG